MASYIPGLTDFIPDIQPFQPDWGTIDRTLRTKQGRYDQGYSSLQSTYSGLLNMPQLKQDQIDKREKFLKGAFKNIGDLSTVDLSLPENVAAAQNVFAPLYEDTDFLGNASISKHYIAQESYAQSLVQKDGGKEFSIDNLNYVRKQKNEYINDNSPDAWKKYYNNKRYYESYYDYNKEYRDIMEKFKPSSIVTTRMNGMYFVKETDKGAKEQDIKRYLDANLSNKAKRQMQIEASVRLANNPEGLLESYKSVGTRDLNMYTAQLNKVDTAINNSKNPQEIEALHDLKSKLSDKVEEAKSTLDKVNAWDLDFVQQNKDSLAYNIYYNNLVDKVAKGYSYEDKALDITANSVALGMWKDAQDWGRMYAGFKNQKEMAYLNSQLHSQEEILKAQLEGQTSGPGVGGVAIGIPSDEGDVVNRTLETVKDEITGIQQQKFNLSNDLKEHVAKITKLPKDQVTIKVINDYINSPQGRRDNFVVNEYNPAMNDLAMAQDARNAEIESGKREVAKNLPKDVIKAIESADKKLGTIKDFLIRANGKNKIISAKSISKIIADGGDYNDIISSIFKNSNIGVTELNDKETSSLRGFINSVNKVVITDRPAFQAHKKFDESLKNYFDNKETSIRKGLVFNDESKPVKETKGYIAAMLPNIPATRVAGVQYDLASNRVYFGIEDARTGDTDYEVIVRSLQSRGLKADYNKAAGKYYIEGSGIPGTDAFKNFTPQERELLILGQDTGNEYQSPFYYPSGIKDSKGNKNPGFRFEKTTTSSGTTGYYLYVDGFDKPLRNKKYNDLFSLMTEAKQLSQNPDLLMGLLN